MHRKALNAVNVETPLSGTEKANRNVLSVEMFVLRRHVPVLAPQMKDTDQQSREAGKTILASRPSCCTYCRQKTYHSTEITTGVLIRMTAAKGVLDNAQSFGGSEGLVTYLQQEYNKKFQSVRQLYSCWLLEGDGGKYALWDYGTAEKERDLEGALQCLEYLNMHSRNLPRLLKTADNKRSFSKDGKNFFLSSFPEGQSIEGTNTPDVAFLAARLLEIHEKSRSWTGMTGSRDWRDSVPNLQRILFDLLQYKIVLEKKRFHTDFELMFLENFDYLYNQGQESLENMTLAGVYSPQRAAVFLVNSFTPGFIFAGDGYCQFADLHRISFGSRINDLAMFLNSFMPAFGWDIRILVNVINNYKGNQDLSTAERHILIAQLRFPSRFWLYAYQYLHGVVSVPLENLLKEYIFEWRLRDKALDEVESWLLGE